MGVLWLNQLLRNNDSRVINIRLTQAPAVPPPPGRHRQPDQAPRRIRGVGPPRLRRVLPAGRQGGRRGRAGVPAVRQGDDEQARGAGGVHVVRGGARVRAAGAMHTQGERRRDDAVRGEFQLLGGGELEDK